MREEGGGGERTKSANSLDLGTAGFILFRIGVGILGVWAGLDEQLEVALVGRFRTILSGTR